MCGRQKLSVCGPWRLQLLPLIRSQHAPDLPQHPGIGFFQFRARLSDAVDLSQDLRVVRRVGIHQRLQSHFFLLQSGLQVDEFQAMLLEDVVQVLALVAG